MENNYYITVTFQTNITQSESRTYKILRHQSTQ